MIDREEAEKEAQALLADAQKIIDRVTVLAREHDLDGLQFMHMTFHSTMNRWGGTAYRLIEPDWYDNEYWSSSSAGCEIGIVYPGEEP